MDALPERLSILIVDDNPEDRAAYMRVLSADPELNCTFLEAESGEHGVRLYAEHRPDCTLLDYLLPDSDGLEVLGELTRLADCKPAPVVMLTAHGDEQIAVEAMKAGALDYMVKAHEMLPEMPRTVHRALREWSHIVEKRAAEDALKRMNEELEREVDRRTAALVEANTRMAEEISERERAEQELEQSRRLLQTVVDTVPYRLVAKNREGRFLLVNHAFTRFFGLRSEQIVGMLPAEMTSRPRDEVDEAMRDDQRVLCGAADQLVLDYTRRDSTGKILHFRNIKSAFRDKTGEIAGLVDLAVDVTELKHAQEELSRHLDQLEELVNQRTHELREMQHSLLRQERLATIGRLTATVNHELRNPLGTIATSVHALRRHLPVSDQRAIRVLERMDKSITRCTRIVDELLSYTRRGDAVFRPVNADRWLASTLQEHGPQEGIDLDVDLDADVEISVDEQRLRQAILNVMENAAQSMLESACDPARLRLSSRIEGEQVVFRVADSGPGIPADARPMIFEPLFSTRAFGIGLGLPLVREIMDEHRGGAEVEVSGADGTVMKLWVPRSPGTDPG